MGNVTKSFEGTVAGVQVASGGGQPGEAASVIIRGIGSVNASATPLYVVDGIPFDGSLSSINPADIETMTVLKDASAGALYGARGANGVIVITTKKGKKDKIRISYKGNVGIASRAIPRYDLVGMKDYVEMSYEALRNSAQYGTGMDFEGASRYAAANLGQQIGGLKNPEYYNPYKNYTWETLMGSFNRNKVLSLTGGQDVITSGIRVIEVGRPIYTFYLPKTAGVDPATGKQLYYAYWTQTVNDEGSLVNTRCDEYITDNVAMATLSKYYHESREPKLFGSIGSTFTILKNIDVSFLTTYSIGGWVYDGLYNGSMYVQYAGNNWHKNAKRRWQRPGDKTDVPMLEVGGSYATADNSLIDASYFAIKNITVGYTLPKRWLKKIDIESLRIYATLDNIAMFNHMDGMDPQYNFTGSVAYSYTPSRVIAFGIDLNF